MEISIWKVIEDVSESFNDSFEKQLIDGELETHNT